ncbi:MULTISPECIES: phage tail protein [Paenibacillus]|uniref:phage tail protein n=1 Tax=Paenibacillus TaxID=44249 RepID=UPI0022B89737|nr:tail fiber protein [Paenibacillus caseinilyticus]MCZ8523997.1 tail fiber protein [Paenibacillus caseinilyticus]
MSEPYIGEIRMFGGNFAPQGWAICNGQLLSIADNTALFSLIGTTYGGDGQSTFGLPDLRGRAPVHQGQNPVTRSHFTMGQMSGVETVMLTQAQIPAHTHTVQAQKEPGTAGSPAGAVWAASAVNPYAAPAGAPSGAMHPAAVAPAGGNQPHDNMMPYLAIQFIISLEGIYPSQN